MRYVLNLSMITTCTCGFTEINEAKRSVPVLGWLTGGRVGRFHGVTLHPWFRSASGDELETTAQRERQTDRERKRAFWWLQQL